MWLWTLCFLSGLLGFRVLGAQFDFTGALFGLTRERVALSKVISTLQEIEETLAAGLIPAQERWSRIQDLASPWGPLAHESLTELRAQGGSLVPTLRRLRTLAQEHQAALLDARARSAQAFLQAGICSGMVPLFGFTLYWVLPGVSERPWAWGIACLLAFVASCVAALWMMRLAESARWAGLASSQRSWVLGVQCSGERLLSLIRAGNPVDIAWAKATQFLSSSAPELVLEWGTSVWKTEEREEDRIGRTRPAERILFEFGISLRKSLQVSLLEGRPCLDRIESVLQGFRQEMRAQIERELSVLTTRVLKPLFIFVAPALLSLLAFGLFIAWSAVLGETHGF